MSQAAAAAAVASAAATASASAGNHAGSRPLQSSATAASTDIPDPNDPTGQAIRRRVPNMYIQDKTRRHITFSKRKAGLLKKANELACLTGTEVLLLIASEAGTIYFHATDKFRPLVDSNEAKQRISDCL
ncbi:SRF-type transcription factor (DNA-binding and dimerization domain)-domain-containing protein, partial [Catenaria anguillulae PL171]